MKYRTNIVNDELGYYGQLCQKQQKDPKGEDQ